QASFGPQDICQTFRADCELITTLIHPLSPSRRPPKRGVPGQRKAIGALHTEPAPVVSADRGGRGECAVQFLPRARSGRGGGWPDRPRRQGSMCATTSAICGISRWMLLSI